MSSVLPSSVNYSSDLQSLPQGSKCYTQTINPNNGSTFSQNQIVSFDFLSRGFIDPESIYLSYSYSITSAVGAEIPGTPFYTFLQRSEVLAGSVIIESINDYGVVCNVLVNTTLGISDKYGAQNAYGYLNETGVPTLESLDGRTCILNETGSFSGVLPNILSSCERLIPAFACPQLRLNLTLSSLASTFTSAVTPTAYTLSNMQLSYRMIEIPSAQAYTMSLDRFYIKSNGFTNSSVTVPSGTSGSNSFVFNQRLASIKSALLLHQGTDATSINKLYDSFAPSATATLQLNIAGELTPSTPLSLALNKSRVLMELKQAIGSIYEKASNAMSINSIEFGRVSGTSSTLIGPAKFYAGFNLQTLAGGLLTGVSTQNSPITVVLNTTATAQTLQMSLILNYDALIEISPMDKQVSVKQ